MRRRFGRRGTGGGGRGFGGTLGLMIGAVGLGALIFFLLRRTRGDDVRESVERVSETVRSGAEEYVGTSSREESESPAGQEGATTEGDTEGRRQTVRRFADRLEEQRPADQEQGQEEGEESSEGAGEDIREELRSIVRESVRRSEESSRGREEGGSTEAQEETGASKDIREELRSTVRESVRRSESSSRGREEGGSEETAEEQEGRTGQRTSAGGQVTVVGVLAKMGEAFEETGGGRFILSTEDEGNFDLHGKEDELDEIYQQQIQAEVVGRITDEDAQPRIMEVDEVRSA
ncbi:MAG: hypothetical protein M3N45_02195 [Actinomycetota bacterium]|nr:hypothetical protein [Actinomycetota bacterium]